MPCEFFEAFYPVRVEKLALRPDSGGPGQFRGGLGYWKEIRFLVDGFIMVADDRMLLQPFGAAGGKAGTGSLYTLNPETERELPIPNKTDFVPIKSGDVLRILTPGGGGWGDPLDREPQEVLQDVRLDRVSMDSARHDYGIVIDRDSMKVLASPPENHRSGGAFQRPPREETHFADLGRSHLIRALVGRRSSTGAFQVSCFTSQFGKILQPVVGAH
jgi:N-methylhydantoinase B/oxoprolinase/acetone carboxylase alpha subunit